MFDSGVAVRSSASSLSIRLVWPFLDIARQHNCLALIEQFKSRLGLNRVQLDHPDTRVSLRIAGALLAELAEQTELQSIGLAAAQKIRSEHLGLAEYLARSRDTLGAALVSSVQFARLLCDGLHHSVELQDNLVFLRFWFDATIAMPDAAYEFALATQLNGIRRITRRSELEPLEAHFMHPEPKDTAPHERLFHCRIRFNMPFTQLVLPASALALPLPGSEPALSRLLERQAHLSLAELPDAKGFVPRVRNIVAAELSQGKTTAKRIARRLGISQRTLARRLASEDSSFQLLFDQTRKDLALRELAGTPRSIREIARRLGFASTQSFHRAFRRWTGATITSYRKSTRHSLAV